MDLKDAVFKLSSSYCAAGETAALRLCEEYLKEYCEVFYTSNGTLVGKIKGESDESVAFDAHCDEVGFIVTEVSEYGFVKVSEMGRCDLRILPSQRVVIMGKEKVEGLFCSVPPHLKGGNSMPENIGDLYIDTALGEKARELIPLGSPVFFDIKPKSLLNNRITGKALDNRACVAALIYAASLLKDEKPEKTVYFVISNQEEIGCRGAFPACFQLKPQECVVVDTTFAAFPTIPNNKTGIIDKGPLIGISPVLSREVSDKLMFAAADINAPYQYEVMGRSTGTNADNISTVAGGIKTTTLSIPITNMHTPSETASLNDIENCGKILARYMSGGFCNA